MKIIIFFFLLGTTFGGPTNERVEEPEDEIAVEIPKKRWDSNHDTQCISKSSCKWCAYLCKDQNLSGCAWVSSTDVPRGIEDVLGSGWNDKISSGKVTAGCTLVAYHDWKNGEASKKLASYHNSYRTSEFEWTKNWLGKGLSDKLSAFKCTCE